MLKFSQKSTIIIDAERFQNQFGNHDDRKVNAFLEETLLKIKQFAGSDYEIFSTISTHSTNAATLTRLNSLSAQILPVNGNRDTEMRAWMRRLAKHIREERPGQVFIVTDDERLTKLIGYIREATYVRVWFLGEKVSPAFLDACPNCQPFNAVLPDLKLTPLEKSAIFVDFENVFYALADQYGAGLEPEQAYQAIIDAVGQPAEAVKYFFYADFGAMARKIGDVRKSIEIINFLVMHNVEVIHVVNRRGKNGADIRITLDGIALVKQGLFQRFGVVSCDSDFSALFNDLKGYDVKTLLIGVSGVTSLITRQAAQETRYLDNYLPYKLSITPLASVTPPPPPETIAQSEQTALTLIKLDLWQRKNRWNRFFYKDRLRRCPVLSPEERQVVERFLREGWLMQAEGETEECVCFNPTIGLVKAVLYLVSWLPDRVHHLRTDNNGHPMSYVDTEYLVRGMSMGNAKDRLKAALDYLPGETWLNLAHLAGLIHQETDGDWGLVTTEN